MQQTDKYKLNKPGVDDPITPVPLNENMDKIEAALTAEAETRAAETAGLDSRVTVLEANKIVFGTFTAKYGSGGSATLGFTPKAVLAVQCTNYNYFAMVVGNTASYSGDGYNSLKIVENGFSLQSTSGFSGDIGYIAFG